MRKIFIAILSVVLLTSPGWSASKLSKERGDAFLKSLLIPGWGQYDNGYKRSALVFVFSELAIFGGMYAFHQHGVAKRSDYKAYAAQHAGVVDEHPHGFYVDIGNWDCVEDYNEQRLQDREFDRLYTSSLDWWEWNSSENRLHMEKIRIQSDRAFNSVYFLIGGLVLNHIASAIHAGRAVSREKKQNSAFRDWNLSFIPLSGGQGLSLHLDYSF